MKITALRKTWISGASLAAVLLVSGLSPVEARAIADDHTAAHAEQSRDAGAVIDDTWITTKVKSKLLAEGDVSGLDIAVETRENIVYLTGHAETQAQIDLATRLARETEGVARVDTSALRVEGTAGRARGAAGMDRDRDTAAERDARGRDAYDDDAHDERRSAGEAVSDAWITTKVKSKLLADSDVSGLDVSVETRDNVVYLSGEAESQTQVTRAAQLARETEGVTRVDATALRVETATGQVREATGMDRDRDTAAADDADSERRSAGEAAGDAWITTKVKSKLLADSDVSGLDVSVETRNNVVYLSGEAETQAQVTRASQLARETEGVTRVDATALRVETATGQVREAVGMDRTRERGVDRDRDVVEEGRYGDDDNGREAGEVIDDSWITTKVKSKLLADGDVSGFDISVETRNNVVHLSGAVETQAQIDEAVRLAAETEGVARVDASRLRIGDE